ncbi:MAG: GNAT family N-acetyltransferase [Planctomycetota bacterium]|jgi:ribosomal protein S18 acetylase RimI-like enzyme
MSSSQARADQLRQEAAGAQGGAALGAAPGSSRCPGETDSIIRINADRRLEAIERLIGTGSGDDRTLAERFIDFSTANAIRLDALWSQLDESGRLECSVLAVPSPGRTAMVFASRPRSRGGIPRIGGLIDHACHQLPDLDVAIAQALLGSNEVLERQAYEAGGFRTLAELSYLERPVESRRDGPPPAWPAGVAVEAYGEERRDELLAALEESYEGTLDCPGLRGLRQTEDILEGHRGTGQFDPSLWTLLRVDGRMSGMLLLNPSSARDTVELVYLGVSPRVRGRGLGRQLLRHGMFLLAGRRERTVTLAVDNRNHPALALYRSEGFRRVLRRLALIRPVSPQTSRISADD